MSSDAEKSATAAYEAAKLLSEGTRQSERGAAQIEWGSLSGPQPATALTTLIRQAELDHYDRLIVAALANGFNPASLIQARSNVLPAIPPPRQG